MGEITICYEGQIVTRSHAQAAGLSRYFDAKPCKYGHIAERTTCSRYCIKCRNEATSRYRSQNKEATAAYARKRYLHRKQISPEKFNEYGRHAYRRRQDHIGVLIGRHKPERCDLCGEKAKRICFDHCHTTGRFRGWLCVACNMAIGATRDSPELLRKMADYLEDASGDGCCVADGLQLVFQVKKGKLKWQKA